MNEPQVASAFIEGQRKTAYISARGAEKLKLITDQCWSMGEKDLPSTEMMNVIGSYNTDHFKINMIQFFTEFYWRDLIGFDSTVLDLGCGCGRLAIPISRMLESGRYYGVDVWGEGIDWCKANITSVYKNSQFYRINAINNYYFSEKDNGLNNEFSLNFVEGQSVDFTFAISLFSHLLKRDAISYYNEIGRLMKKGGIVYVTGFVIDRYFVEFSGRTGKHTSLQEEEDGCFYGYSKQDFFAGFTMDV